MYLKNSKHRKVHRFPLYTSKILLFNFIVFQLKRKTILNRKTLPQYENQDYLSKNFLFRTCFIKLNFIKDLQYSMVHATFIEILLNKYNIALYLRDINLQKGQERYTNNYKRKITLSAWKYSEQFLAHRKRSVITQEKKERREVGRKKESMER